ncbi:BTAD domain-containing putative transcriptional regulator [Actinoplanes sp. TFC3]|uniref:BTAD domain-containing putative transcriptional regulator n=1 Tax=Actinoplanes sp. TFC3 TaxID=1710355 RepID=UPI001290889F
MTGTVLQPIRPGTASTRALLQHRACVSVLRSDLGVDPSPGTQGLHLRIRRHEAV